MRWRMLPCSKTDLSFSPAVPAFSFDTLTIDHFNRQAGLLVVLDICYLLLYPPCRIHLGVQGGEWCRTNACMFAFLSLHTSNVIRGPSVLAHVILCQRLAHAPCWFARHALQSKWNSGLSTRRQARQSTNIVLFLTSSHTPLLAHRRASRYLSL